VSYVKMTVWKGAGSVGSSPTFEYHVPA